MLAYTVSSPRKSFFTVNLIVLLLCGVTFLVPFWIAYALRSAKNSKLSNYGTSVREEVTSLQRQMSFQLVQELARNGEITVTLSLQKVRNLMFHVLTNSGIASSNLAWNPLIFWKSFDQITSRRARKTCFGQSLNCHFALCTDTATTRFQPSPILGTWSVISYLPDWSCLYVLTIVAWGRFFCPILRRFFLQILPRLKFFFP